MKIMNLVANFIPKMSKLFGEDTTPHIVKDTLELGNSVIDFMTLLLLVGKIVPY